MIGAKIRDLRNKIGMTQQQLAGHELTKSYVSQVELGRIHPSRKALNIMAKRLGKPLGYFLDNEGDLNTVNVLIQAGQALIKSHRLDEAEIGLNEAHVLAERIGRDDLLAHIEAIIGRVDMARQDYPAAILHLTSALTRLNVLDDVPQLVSVCVALGEATHAAGLFHEAVRYMSQSVETARLSGNADLKGETLMRYGDFCLQMEQWQSALALYEEAHKIAAGKPGLTVRLIAARSRVGRLDNDAVFNSGLLHDLTHIRSGALRWQIADELVRTLLNRKRIADAVELIEQSIAAVKSRKTPSPDDWAPILAAALDTARQAGERSLSQRYLALVNEQPDSASLAPVKAKALRLRADESDNLDARLALMDAACSLMPQDRDLAVARAVTALRAGRSGALDALWALAVESSQTWITVGSK